MHDNDPPFWQRIKPRLIDAAIVGTGVGVGAGLGSMGSHVLKHNTEIGRLWEKLPPSTRMKIVVPVTAGLGAAVLALSSIRDTYRHKEEEKLRDPLRAAVVEDKTQIAHHLLKNNASGRKDAPHELARGLQRELERHDQNT